MTPDEDLRFVLAVAARAPGDFPGKCYKEVALPFVEADTRRTLQGQQRKVVLRLGLILGLSEPLFLWNLSVHQEVAMNKKYIVRLTDEERALCEATIQKETGKSEKLRRATILLKADADGPAWTDAKISEAVGCRSQTVENVRQAFVLNAFEAALVRKKRATSPTPKLLDGAAEAKLIALRLGKPPAGFNHWTLRLLADQMVELEIVESISPETVRQTLKKMA